MQFILAGEEVQDLWNEFVRCHPRGHLYQSYEWGKVLSYKGSKVIRGGVENNGRLCAVISMVKKEIPFLDISYLYAPSGPIVDFSNGEVLACLLKGIKTIAEDNNAVCLRIDPDCPDDHSETRNALLGRGFIHLNRNWSSHNYPRLVMRVDLQSNEEQLLKQMRKKHRQHINSTQRNGLAVITGEEEDHLRRFWCLLQALGCEKRFLVRSYPYFEELRRNFIGAGTGKLLLAKYDGEIIGGALALRYGRGCWYLYGASGTRFQHLCPNERLHWEMIKWAKSMGCTVYDMGGTGTDYPVIPGSKNYSLYHFKNGFGAKLVYLTGYYDLVFRPPSYRVFRFGEEYMLPWGLGIASSLLKLKQRFA